MDEKTIAFLYLNVYCVSLFIVETLLVLYHHELESTRGMVNVVFDVIALIALLGYAYDKRLSSKYPWMIFAAAFFLWEIGGYVYLDPQPLRINVMMVIMLAPLYWGVALYPFLTLEEDEAKRIQLAAKREALKERFKSLMVIGCALSLLFLLLCFYAFMKMS